MAKKTLISIVQLGIVDYATGLRLQEQLVALRKEEKIGDVLLLLEHKPVITLGRNAKAANVIASPELLRDRGVELFETNRGGDVTFHGPGQIVCYPIFDLRAHPNSQSLSSRSSRSESDGESRDFMFPLGTNREGHDFRRGDLEQKKETAFAAEVPTRKHLGAVDFVRRLEEVLIRSCADFAIPTKRVPGLTGVWTDLQPLSFRAEENDSKNRSLESRNPLFAEAGKNAEAKLAAIGIHISRFVTSHGFALNVNTDLSYFNLIIPCGITTKPVTSMQQQLKKELDLNTVAESISRNFGVVFQTQMLWVDTLDALLGTAAGEAMQVQNEFRQLHADETSGG